jgi:phage terminase large subunit-like protein
MSKLASAIKWSTSCVYWESRIVKGQTLIPFDPLYMENADEALTTFDALRMVDAANSPTFGEVCRPWVRDFVAQIFGSYENETGIRHISEYFMLISKKNGKSTTAAAIMMVALILTWRQDAEFIILSPTIEIANNSFKPAASMVRADEDLNDLFIVQDHIRTITHRTTGATLKVVAADSNTVSGKKAVGVLVDELWLFGKDAKADAMLMEATGGLASRPEGFIIYMTTQSDDPPAGVYKAKLQYARDVRDGKISDPQFLPVIYEFPKEMIERKLHMLPENFYVTNPNLTVAGNPAMGGSVSVEFLQRGWRKAQEEGPEKIRLFLAKHLNVEIGLNLRSDRWPGADFWEVAAKLPRVGLDYLIDNCEVVTGGVDGGGLDDLLGAAAIGRERDWTDVNIPAHIDETTGEEIPEQTHTVQRWVCWMHAWAHKSVLDRRKDIESKLRDLMKDGLVTLVSYAGQDAEQMANCFSRIDKAGLLFQIGFDPACIGGLLDALLQAEIEPEKMVKVNQGYRLAGSIKTAERKLWEGVMVHDGNALGNWCVGNAKVVVRGNGVYITKQVSGTAKIDPLIALFNAVDIMQLNPEAQSDTFDASKMVIAG